MPKLKKEIALCFKFRIKNSLYLQESVRKTKNNCKDCYWFLNWVWSIYDAVPVMFRLPWWIKKFWNRNFSLLNWCNIIVMWLQEVRGSVCFTCMDTASTWWAPRRTWVWRDCMQWRRQTVDTSSCLATYATPSSRTQ